VVPGGGAALLRCSAEGSGGERILGRALAAPLRLIARQAGFDAARVAAEAQAHCGESFDVLRGGWTRDLVDPYAVVAAALEASVSAALTAATAEAVIRRHA